jgi:hypothetical protein
MHSKAISARAAMSDTWLLEIWLSFYALLWGLAILNPWSSVFSTGPLSFALISQLPGGEWFFGLVVTILGFLKLYIVLYGTRKQRSISSCLLGVFWILIFVAVGIPTNWGASSLALYAQIVVGHWFIWVRLQRKGVVA